MYVYFNKFFTHSFNHLYNIDQQMTRYSSTFLSSWLLLVIIALLNIDASMLKHIYIYAKSCRQCRTNRTKISMALVLMSSLL